MRRQETTPALSPFGAVEIIAEGHHDQRITVVLIGRNADPGRALVGQRPDINVLAEMIATAQFGGELGQFLCTRRNVDPQNSGVVLPAVVVFLGPYEEQVLLLFVKVAADALEDAGAVVQRMGQNVDVRFGERDESVVEPDDGVGIGDFGFHWLTSSFFRARPRVSALRSMSSQRSDFTRRWSAWSIHFSSSKPDASTSAPSIRILPACE